MNATTDKPALVIAGTDTDVGKTWVTAVLAAVLVKLAQRPIQIIKPVQTGVPSPDHSDAATAHALAGTWLEPLGLSHLLAPWQVLRCYPEPATPMVADERGSISPHVLVSEVETVVTRAPRQSLSLVELAGGLRVPIAAGFTNLELIKQLNWPVVVVARTALGTINHTLLTVERLLSEGCTVAGVILNDGPPALYQHQMALYPVAVKTAREMLESFLPSTVPVIGPLPSYAGSATLSASGETSGGVGMRKSEGRPSQGQGSHVLGHITEGAFDVLLRHFLN